MSNTHPWREQGLTLLEPSPISRPGIQTRPLTGHGRLMEVSGALRAAWNRRATLPAFLPTTPIDPLPSSQRSDLPAPSHVPTGMTTLPTKLGVRAGGLAPGRARSQRRASRRMEPARSRGCPFTASAT